MSSTSNRYSWLTLLNKKLIISFFITPFLLSACGAKDEEKLPQLPEVPVSVEVSSLNQLPTYSLSEVGTVKASKEVEIVAKASGIVDPLLISIGDSVTEGQNLGSIDVSVDTAAKINLDTAKSQLANAQQSYDETIANNEDIVTKAQIQIDSLQATLNQLNRNLGELGTNNESTLATLQLQIENAQKNVNNAEISRDNLEAQFDQTWENFFDTTEINFDTIFVNANNYYQNITDIINPSHQTSINSDSYNRLLGVKNSTVTNQTIQLYNQFNNRLKKSQLDYENLLPLNFDSIDQAVNILKNIT